MRHRDRDAAADAAGQDLLGIGGGQPLDDGQFLARVRERIASAPGWKGPVSLAGLLDLLMRRMKDGDGKARSRADALIEERIRQLVESAPPLTQAQRERLAALLSGTPG